MTCEKIMELCLYVSLFIISISLAAADDDDCVDLTASSTTQTFTSLGDYPRRYENYADDCWVITAKEDDKKVQLTVVDSRIESILFLSCSWIDFLEVRDGDGLDSHILLRWCGSGIPPHSPFVSSGDSMYVRFHSDYSVNRGGFKLQYKSVSTQEATTSRAPDSKEPDPPDEDESHRGPDWRLQRNDEWHNGSDKLHRGVIAAIVIGSIIMLLLMAVGICFVTKLCKGSERHTAATTSERRSGTSYIGTTNLLHGPIVITGGAAGGIVNPTLLPDSPTQKKKFTMEPPSYALSTGQNNVHPPAVNGNIQNERNSQLDRSRRRPSDVHTTTMMSPGGPPGDAPPVAHANSILPPIGNTGNEDAPADPSRGGSLPPLNPAGGTQLTATSFDRGGPLPPISNEDDDLRPPPTPDYMGPVSPPPPYSPNYNEYLN